MSQEEVDALRELVEKLKRELANREVEIHKLRGALLDIQESANQGLLA